MRDLIIDNIRKTITTSAQGCETEEMKNEMLEELEMFEGISMDEHQAIEIGSIIELETNSRVATYFISPANSGSILNIKGQSILVVSIFSALGAELMGKVVGESIELVTAAGIRVYKVVSIN
ncbi:GreA/GreB family elongation factor [Bacteriovorax sp. Seq25_V]|uniref:GreA/GreB family elongation factor n=1 Tax=Bacteriovorax sp. Seq25_V TaxID=1201288 RepID=UPI00038A11F8|nr:GreA/GreB family elongation factor [Bacteriovorax sp. Seq25_V]EQC45338.1 transcription elongation factor GreA/GreB, C-terminal domain protein [Bacteriovorax sp. Seq25_V]